MAAEPKNKKNKIRYGVGSVAFDVCNVIFFVLLALLMILPFWNVLVVSISTQGEYMRTPFLIFPKEPTLQTYKFLFSSPLIPRAYLMTIVITVGSTIFNLLCTSMLAYALSKTRIHGRAFFLIFLMFTMFFSGGIIPSYLLIKNTLHLDNTLWALILPGGVNVFNFVIMKSFFAQLPASLEESAKLDGANDFVILWRIIYPLSIPTLATIGLWVAVANWNGWFAANLYLRDSNLYPLQLVIRNYILKSNKPQELAQAMAGLRDSAGRPIAVFEEGMKMATVVVAVIPLLLIYPFTQKYFEKGITLGSVKG